MSVSEAFRGVGDETMESMELATRINGFHLNRDAWVCRSVDVMPLGPAGTYTVNYRVTSADGHVVSGSWPFLLTTAGTGRPGPPAAAPGNAGRIPAWPFLAIGAVLAVGAGWWALRRRRGRG
jgi:hypothetical protein